MAGLSGGAEEVEVYKSVEEVELLGAVACFGVTSDDSLELLVEFLELSWSVVLDLVYGVVDISFCLILSIV